MLTKNLKYLVLILLVAVCTPASAKVKIQDWHTKHGSQVLFVETHELPIIDVNVIFYAGSLYDGKKHGLANFTSSMLDAGTRDLSTDQIADKFAEVGAKFHAGTSLDKSNVTLRCLTELKILNPALEIFTQVLNEPIFPTQEIVRIKKQLLNWIQQQKQDPGSVASEEFFKNLYGDFPYNHNVIGTAETVAATTQKDLKEFYSKHYTAKNAVVIIVGDVTRKLAENIAEQVTSKLPIGNAANKVTIKQNQTSTKVKHIEFPSTQTNVIIGKIGIARDDPDYFPLFLGNYILGASPLTSELFIEVREKLGMVYHIWSGFIATQYPGPFMIGFSSSNEKAQEAINVSTKTLGQFIQNGPTEKRLLAAKKSVTGQFPIRLANNANIMRELETIAFYHLPLDYLDTYVEKINAVTLKQIQEAFEKHLDLDKMLIVTVGR